LIDDYVDPRVPSTVESDKTVRSDIGIQQIALLAASHPNIAVLAILDMEACALSECRVAFRSYARETDCASVESIDVVKLNACIRYKARVLHVNTVEGTGGVLLPPEGHLCEWGINTISTTGVRNVYLRKAKSYNSD